MCTILRGTETAHALESGTDIVVCGLVAGASE